MSKNKNQANLDTYEMQNRAFDQDADATRVILVGGENISINAELPEIKFPDQQIIEKQVIVKEVQEIRIPEIIKETKIEFIEKQVIVKEYEKIEVPILITKIEYVEKPTYIEIPRIVSQGINKIPNFVYICVILQTVCFIVLAIKQFIK